MIEPKIREELRAEYNPEGLVLRRQQMRYSYGTWCYREARFEGDLFPLTTIKFEGYDFLAPHDSDAYLRNIYGDYMQIQTNKEIHAIKVEFLK